MLQNLARRVFGTPNDRYLKTLTATVDKINGLESEFEALSDAQVKAKTDEFKQRYADGEGLDALLPEAFANCREAAKRVYGMRHFDVQLMGGIVLHRGEIAEMKTGEGKTLTATLAVYLNALTGEGAHVITVNDYLATRDAEEMGRIYEFLGMTTGCIVPDIEKEERQKAYASDVTYGTNNEIGFDYLRDNMEFRLDEMVQRGFNFGIVDEVDSILVDEARTPLIISGPAEDSSELYIAVDKLLPQLKEDDYELDEKAKQVIFTEDGVLHMETLMAENGMAAEGSSLYDIDNVGLLHHANQALRAHKLFNKDKDYIVKGQEVVIIDEFTGRAMEGRRFSDGLHQALEAKESVNVKPENQTLASVTFQNLFRMYDTLSGMTGTAMTEAEEFSQIYGLDVVEIPTNEPMIREDNDDEVYRTTEEKNEAIIRLIKEAHERKQPVLVGTVTIEKSETLAADLKKAGVPHNVLNARFHEQEAMIIAQAGRPGGVTIATNMAGRGTDIQLGGNAKLLAEAEPEGGRSIEEIAKQVETDKEAVRKAGGLYVIGTERHESRRIDNQLRGRSGRQGDPGASNFYLSLEDDLMRIFGSERMDSMLRRLGLEEGEAIIHPWINKAVEKAQMRVESRNYDFRKNILKFDNVMNDQRLVIYDQRRHLMETDDVSEDVKEMRQQVVEDLITQHIPPKSYPDQWDTPGLEREIQDILGTELPVEKWADEEGVDEEILDERINSAFDSHMAKKAAEVGPEVMRLVEKSVSLQFLDQLWKEHLLRLIQLRDGVGLRALAQRDPLQDYKRESFEMFEGLLSKTNRTVTQYLAQVEISTGDEEETVQDEYGNDVPAGIMDRDGNVQSADSAAEDWGKVPRNAPCPCGSGKKYKHCHGAIA